MTWRSDFLVQLTWCNIVRLRSHIMWYYCSTGKGNGYGSVVLDDCNFHECVKLDEFESGRTLHFLPPEGEFAVLNYRVTGDFRCPFKILPAIEEPAPYKLEVMCMIRFVCLC